MKKLSELKPGEQAQVERFTDQEVASRCLEMGCTPGIFITIEQVAPLGDPLMISFGSTFIGLRKQEAESIAVKFE
jgi:ferrous iron transport protein A